MCLTVNCKSADLGWPQLELEPLSVWSLLQQANFSPCKVRAVKATTTKKKPGMHLQASPSTECANILLLLSGLIIAWVVHSWLCCLP